LKTKGILAWVGSKPGGAKQGKFQVSKLKKPSIRKGNTPYPDGAEIKKSPDWIATAVGNPNRPPVTKDSERSTAPGNRFQNTEVQKGTEGGGKKKKQNLREKGNQPSKKCSADGPTGWEANRRKGKDEKTRGVGFRPWEKKGGVVKKNKLVWY